jgi:uncharacterized membrane protein
MKNKMLVLPLSILFITCFFIQAKRPSKIENTVILADSVIEFNKEVRIIIDSKCMGCHNQNSKNEKGKAKLKWDSLALYPKVKQIAKLDDIIEVLEKGEMPPAKFLANKPEAKLTEDEVKMLTQWANDNADKLLK